jgi:LacI family repressor for deo operon, udp, cdd, tsx, nupC, and nupG
MARRRKPVTIKDVAREAGVSITTVSNVLNDRAASMSEATLQRVLQVMETLNYRPNPLARGLVTRRTATIGVIIAEIETPLFLQALNRIEPIARQAGYSVLMSNASDPAKEYEVLNLFLEKRVDGLIFLSVSEWIENDHVPELERLNVPTVLVNRAKTYANLDQINWDDTTGVTEAVEHLIRLGHRRIAHLCGPKRRRSGQNRLHGYKTALERHDIPYRPEYVCSGDYTDTEDVWRASTCHLLEFSPRPTAILASDDIVAAAAIKAIQRAGLHVPRDVAVVGVDDQRFCTYLNPALTTVRLPVLEAGRCAVKMVLDRIASARTESEHVTLPCSLIVRESCGASLAEPILTEPTLPQQTVAGSSLSEAGGKA